jgi:hypothetical protein
MFAMIRRQWRSLLSSIRRRPAKPRKRITGRKARPYRFIVDGKRWTVVDMTRSEARACLKQALNLDRLPVGCSIK